MMLLLAAQIKNCFTYATVEGVDVCLVCDAGYYVSGGACYALFCTKEISRCVYCDPADGTRCIHCSGAEYVAVDGLCVQNRIVLNGEPQPRVQAYFDALRVTAYDEDENRIVRVCRPDLFRFYDTCLDACDAYDLERGICRLAGYQVPYTTDGVSCWDGFKMSATGGYCKPSKCYYYRELDNLALERVYGCLDKEAVCVESDYFFVCQVYSSNIYEPCTFYLDAYGRCVNYASRMWVAFSLFVVSAVLWVAGVCVAFTLKRKTK